MPLICEGFGPLGVSQRSVSLCVWFHPDPIGALMTIDTKIKMLVSFKGTYHPKPVILSAVSYRNHRLRYESRSPIAKDRYSLDLTPLVRKIKHCPTLPIGPPKAKAGVGKAAGPLNRRAAQPWKYGYSREPVQNRWAPGAIDQGQSQSQLPQETYRPLE